LSLSSISWKCLTKRAFFKKTSTSAPYLKDGWQDRVYQAFKDKFPPAILVFYINHLAWEVLKTEAVYKPA